MSIQVTMPQLGESIHEGTIGKWLKQPGDQVERFEPLVEVITDKVSAEVPAPIDGILSRIIVPEGETVEVGALIAEMQEVGAEATVAASAPSQPATANHSNNKEREATGVFPSGTSAGGWYEDEVDELDLYITTPPEEEKPRKPHRYSPAVRRLAEEHHLNLETINIKGSGISGRITREDVMNYLQMQRSVPQAANPVITRATEMRDEPDVKLPEAVFNPAPVPAPATPAAVVRPSMPPNQPPMPAPVPHTVQANEEFVPLTPMRKAIAEHMVRSKQTSPHAWTIVEVDMTRLVKHRAKVKDEFKQREGVDLSYLPFVIQAVIEGLKQYPQLNASFSPEGGIILKRELNIGVAMDVPDGLVVPVIPRADEKSLVGLARGLNDLITRARAKKLTMADLQGGTFTVNNPGAFGSVMSYPIINQPQAAIVTMEAIVKRPIVVTDEDGNDTIAIRSIMNMCLSFDHRVVDGAIGGRFLQSVKKWLENYKG